MFFGSSPRPARCTVSHAPMSPFDDREPISVSEHTAAICPSCGAPLSASPACTRCGTPVDHLPVPVLPPSPVVDAAWADALRWTVANFIVQGMLQAWALRSIAATQGTLATMTLFAVGTAGITVSVLLFRRSQTALRWLTLLATAGPVVNAMTTVWMATKGILAGWALALAVVSLAMAIAWGFALRRARRALGTVAVTVPPP